MPVTRILLLPITFLYKLITDFRNHLYDIGNRKSIEFERYVISVGNLTVGGTGKTPFVELLVRELKDCYQLAILSRGYRRKTHGFRLANDNDSAETLGDEPFQYYTKLGKEVTIAVGEDRALAIPEILFHKDEIQAIILDDAYQHRRVKPHLNIMLCDYHRPFYKDYVLPSGRLRESRKHADRADAIIVTKCPGALSELEMNAMDGEIRRYSAAGTPIFYTGIKYLKPKSIFGDQQFEENVFLFSGIASADPLEKFVSDEYNLLGHKKYPDHYAFCKEDVEEIVNLFNQFDTDRKCLLTTEKDMVRLLSLKEEAGFLLDYPIFYLQIELYFLKNGDFFATYLLDKVKQGVKDIANN